MRREMVEGGAKGETERETSGNAERQRVGAEGGERERAKWESGRE